MRGGAPFVCLPPPLWHSSPNGPADFIDPAFHPARCPHIESDAKVVEIGAGCGLVGIVAARLGFDVALTDGLPDVVDLLARNASANLDATPGPGSHAYTVSLYRWGEDLGPLDPPYDVVLGADCVYQWVPVEALVGALLDLTGPDSVVFMTYEHHNPDSVAAFEAAAGDHFVLEKVSLTWVPVD